MRHVLPAHVDTSAEFAAEMPEPDRIVLFEKGGSRYVEVAGPRPGLPSGRPAYIFDSGGRISYWTIDTGDSAEYWEHSEGRMSSREVSMQEALLVVKGAG
jgi:hypothetical protein